MSGTVELRILDKPYRVQADAGGADLREVGALVNTRVEQIRQAAPGLPTEKIAILVALNLADELLRERTAVEAAANDVRERIGRIEAALLGATEPPA